MKREKSPLLIFELFHLPFFHFQYSTFPFTIFLLLFSIFTPLPFFPCLFFPGRFAFPGQKSLTAPRLLRHWWSLFGVRCKKGKRSSKGCFKYVKSRSYKTYDDSAFSRFAEGSLGATCVIWYRLKNTNAAWETFLSLFDHIYNRHAPFKNTKLPCNPIPWLDSDYIELRNKVFKAKYKAEKSKNSHDWESFKTLRNSLNNFACKLKKESFENKLNEAGKNSKKTMENRMKCVAK